MSLSKPLEQRLADVSCAVESGDARAGGQSCGELFEALAQLSLGEYLGSYPRDLEVLIESLDGRVDEHTPMTSVAVRLAEMFEESFFLVTDERLDKRCDDPNAPEFAEAEERAAAYERAVHMLLLFIHPMTDKAWSYVNHNSGKSYAWARAREGEPSCPGRRVYGWKLVPRGGESVRLREVCPTLGELGDAADPTPARLSLEGRTTHAGRAASVSSLWDSLLLSDLESYLMTLERMMGRLAAEVRKEGSRETAEEVTREPNAYDCLIAWWKRAWCGTLASWRPTFSRFSGSESVPWAGHPVLEAAVCLGLRWGKGPAGAHDLVAISLRNAGVYYVHHLRGLSDPIETLAVFGVLPFVLIGSLADGSER